MVSQMEKTLNISDQELHNTLNEFLEEKKEKPKESIWNFSTVTGIVLVLVSAAYFGYTIGSELLGLGSLPFMTSIMQFAPYFGGALLAIVIMGMFKKSKTEKIEEQQEEVKVKETYDKLDKFLYGDDYRKEQKRKKAKSDSSFQRFKVSAAGKLAKSRTDKKIAGVCGGIAKYLGINSTIVRLLLVAAVFFSSGSFILLYIALAIIMPKEEIYDMDDFDSF